MARTTFIDLGGRKKGLPRGKPFKKGERLPFQFKPGQSGNPGGRPKSRQTMKSIYESLLGRPAPIELCRAFHLPAKSTFATVIAKALLYRAVYKTSAVKFLGRGGRPDEGASTSNNELSQWARLP